MRIEELPHCVFEDIHPAFNDTESLTAIEMVSRVYGKVQELIDEYNKCVDEINKTITEFIESAEQDGECFKNQINKIMHDYIAMIDEKIKMQDDEIKAVSDYLTDNLAQAITDKVQEMVDDGTMNQVVLDGIDELKNLIPPLETRVTSVEESITTANTNIANHETRIDTAESNITSLDTRMGTAESNITSLDTRMGTAESNIVSLESRVATSEDEITDIQDELEVVKTELPNYVLKNEFAVVTGEVTVTSGSGQATTTYPEGFNQTNCVVLTAGCAYREDGTTQDYGFGFLQSTLTTGAVLGESVIAFMLGTVADTGPSGTFPFKVVLMKI